MSFLRILGHLAASTPPTQQMPIVSHLPVVSFIIYLFIYYVGRRENSGGERKRDGGNELGLELWVKN